MRAIVEMPDSIYRKGEVVARAHGVSVEEFIVRVFEREVAAISESPTGRSTVTLPLVKSMHPGSLDLRNFDFDDLLA